MVDQVPRISREEVALYAQNKAHLIASMVSNGYIMPDMKAPFITLDNIYRIRRKELWIPRKQDLNEPPLCGRPPPKEHILQQIFEAIEAKVMNPAVANDHRAEREVEAQLALHEELTKRTADKRWLLIVLKVLAPQHEYFSKNYAYWRPLDDDNLRNMPLIDNEEGFFDGLARLPEHIRRKNKNLRLTKPQKHALQLRVLQIKEEKAVKRRRAFEAQLQADQEEIGAQNRNAGAQNRANEEEKEPRAEPVAQQPNPLLQGIFQGNFQPYQADASFIQSNNLGLSRLSDGHQNAVNLGVLEADDDQNDGQDYDQNDLQLINSFDNDDPDSPPGNDDQASNLPYVDRMSVDAQGVSSAIVGRLKVTPGRLAKTLAINRLHQQRK